MTQDNTDILVQELKKLHQQLHSAVDKALKNIVRQCDNMNPEMIDQVISRVFADTPLAPKPTTTKKRRGRKAVWAKSSDNSLRHAYAKRHKAGQEIEPELEAALIQRFPGYDATTHTFNKRTPKEKAVRLPRSRVARPYKDLSLNEIAMKYHAAKLAGAPIDDDLHAELKRRYPARYDAQNRILPDKKRGGMQKKPLDQVADNTLKNMYYNARRRGEIPTELNNELARRFPTYNKKMKEFADMRGGYRLATKADIEEVEQRNAAMDARRRAEMRKQKDMQKNAKQTAQPPQATTPAAPVPAAAPSELQVTVRPTKISGDGMHYDVFVNGERILHNHIGTRVQTFLDGTILGVYGRVTDIKNFPDNPSWQIYDTNMNRRTFSQVHPYTKKSVYIKHALPIGTTQLSLEVSNKMRVILDARPTTRIFKIMSDNQKQK